MNLGMDYHRAVILERLMMGNLVHLSKQDRLRQRWGAKVVTPWIQNEIAITREMLAEVRAIIAETKRVADSE